jgi:hypothetical protein
MAKYGHKRWGLGYVDKSALDQEKSVSALILVDIP